MCWEKPHTEIPTNCRHGQLFFFWLVLLSLAPISTFTCGYDFLLPIVLNSQLKTGKSSLHLYKSHETWEIVLPYAPDIRSTALLRQKSKHKVIKRRIIEHLCRASTRATAEVDRSQTYISARKTHRLHSRCMHSFMGTQTQSPRVPHTYHFHSSSTVTTAKRTNNQQPMRMNWKGHSTVLVSCFPPPMWISIKPFKDIPNPRRPHLKQVKMGQYWRRQYRTEKSHSMPTAC